MEPQNPVRQQAKSQWRNARKRLIDSHQRTERTRGWRRELWRLHVAEREALENYHSA
jgi:hypothetical protein